MITIVIVFYKRIIERIGVTMDKKRVAIIGYGNIGHGVLDAVLATDDLEIAGVVRRNPKQDKPSELNNIKVVSNIDELGKVHVAILALPSRLVPDAAVELLAKGISCVDSYDIHSTIYEVRERLDKVAKANDSVAIISAGWDPGTDSILRALLVVMAPKGVTFTNFGPGMSMGHSVCVRSKEGVKDALSMTMPKGDGIHRRMVYVELEEGADFNKVVDAIKTDDYFVHDETHVMAVESVSALRDVGHGVSINRKGVSGATHNQLFEFDMRINNPALTAQVLVSSARAALKQNPGCYTMIELPLIDLLEGEKEKLIRDLV